MSDYERGALDCVQGIPARDNASDEYVEGFGVVYATDAVHAHVMDLENFNAEFSCL